MELLFYHDTVFKQTKKHKQTKTNKKHKKTTTNKQTNKNTNTKTNKQIQITKQTIHINLIDFEITSLLDSIIQVFVYFTSAAWVTGTEGRKEMYYLTTHYTHFIYGYMESHIW